jgi:hypothetical protein
MVVGGGCERVVGVREAVQARAQRTRSMWRRENGRGGCAPSVMPTNPAGEEKPDAGESSWSRCSVTGELYCVQGQFLPLLTTYHCLML